MLRSLLHLEVPGDKTYEQLAGDSPSGTLVLFHFNRHNQGNGESVLEYVHVAELKQLAGTCAFGAFLAEALRDRFVYGLANEGIQRRLLSESNLDFEKAVQIAGGMEAAQKSSQEVKVSEVPVQKVQEYGNSPAQWGRVCWHCGEKGHQSEHCRF